ncbi:MAG TPA: DoxX family membrane protein [Candidatus Limnocylindria bacterium]|nr:DoxX family membrane protein [Candidatus Limnocylindria bacterium]
MYVTDRMAQLAVAIGRVVIGIIFLWAGLEKLLASGAEGFSAAGFLQFGTNGTLGWPFVSGQVAEGTVFNPTHGMWVSLATSGVMPVVNFLVVAGQIGIGVGLILGLFTRFSAAMGTLMMIFFFFAAWEFEFGIVNQHLTYAVVTFGLAVVGAGNYFGLDAVVGPIFGKRFRYWLLSGEPHGEVPAA